MNAGHYVGYYCHYFHLNNHCQLCGYKAPEWAISREGKLGIIHPKKFDDRITYAKCPSCSRLCLKVYCGEGDELPELVPDSFVTKLRPIGGEIRESDKYVPKLPRAAWYDGYWEDWLAKNKPVVEQKKTKSDNTSDEIFKLLREKYLKKEND